MSYNPTEYWTKRGRRYKDDFVYNSVFVEQERVLINYLRPLRFSSVLEVGCGFGRITKLVLEALSGISEYRAVDISPHQIDAARKYVSDERASFEVAELEALPQKRYSLVLAVEVLMHVKPVDIAAVVKQLSGMGDHFIHVDWYEQSGKGASHNFVHDYPSLHGGAMQRIGRQALFHVQNE